MVVISSIATVLFLGGWLPPFPNWLAVRVGVAGVRVDPARDLERGWFLVKTFAFLSCTSGSAARFPLLVDSSWRSVEGVLPVSLVT